MIPTHSKLALAASNESSYEQKADEILEKVKSNEVEYQNIAKEIANKNQDRIDYLQLAEEIVANVRANQVVETKNYTPLHNKSKNETNIVDGILAESRQIHQGDCGKINKNKQGLSILVSFSMPEEVLLKLDAQARKIGARLVIRGLVNNSFKETITYIKRINEQGIIVDIDPKIFAEFNVVQVPVFILTGKQEEKYDKLEGNVTLAYVLKTFADNGDLKDQANHYLSKLANDEGNQ
jgi:conjugal transfer pilus assembly protein TrbC